MKTLKLFALSVALLASASLAAQDMKIDATQSTLQWTGKKVTGEHTGFIELKEAKIKVKDDKIVGGKVVIKMESITNTDIADQEYNQKLVGHLKSEDFFNVEKHPTALLEISDSEAISESEMKIKGNLTIKGITKPIEFKAERNNNIFSALIVIDRSKYDVKYGSGSFYEGLGDKMIYDDFEINAKLVVEEG